MMRRSIAGVVGAFVASLVSSVASADDRPFLYATDADGPRQVEVQGLYAIDVGARRSGAVRFVEPGLGRSGVVQRVGAQVGIAPWIALGAYGLASLSSDADDLADATGGGYAHLTLWRPGDERSGGSLALVASGHRELEGVFAAAVTIAGGLRWPGVRLGASLLLERRFTEMADGLDVVLSAAATLRITGGLEAGVEYVGQDLEDLVEEEEAEGGAAHVFAATMSATAANGTLHLGIGPGIVVTVDDVGFVGRATVAYTF